MQSLHCSSRMRASTPSLEAGGPTTLGPVTVRGVADPPRHRVLPVGDDRLRRRCGADPVSSLRRRASGSDPGPQAVQHLRKPSGQLHRVDQFVGAGQRLARPPPMAGQREAFQIGVPGHVQRSVGNRPGHGGDGTIAPGRIDQRRAGCSAASDGPGDQPPGRPLCRPSAAQPCRCMSVFFSVSGSAGPPTATGLRAAK